MTTTITILGCGSSGGVPRVGNDWGACDPTNPRNRRQRCSILVQKIDEQGAQTNVLVDTSPDLRNQLNATSATHINGVLYTHPHADHIHGIDDLRAFAIRGKKRVDVWADELTSDMLVKRFGYCFKTPPGSEYPPILTLHHLSGGSVENSIDGPGGMVNAIPFRVNHGNIMAQGFRFGNVAYTPDISNVPDESLNALEGLDCWIIDGLRLAPHPSHFSLEDALKWIERLKPKTALITNMHVDLDYDAVNAATPDHVQACFDGQVLRV